MNDTCGDERSTDSRLRPFRLQLRHSVIEQQLALGQSDEFGTPCDDAVIGYLKSFFYGQNYLYRNKIDMDDL